MRRGKLAYQDNGSQLSKTSLRNIIVIREVLNRIQKLLITRDEEIASHLMLKRLLFSYETPITKGKEKIAYVLKPDYSLHAHPSTVNRYLKKHGRIDPKIS